MKREFVNMKFEEALAKGQSVTADELVTSRGRGKIAVDELYRRGS